MRINVLALAILFALNKQKQKLVQNLIITLFESLRGIP